MKAKFVSKRLHRYLALALVLALVFALSGCGGKAGGEKPDGFKEAGAGDIQVDAGDAGESDGDNADEVEETEPPRITNVNSAEAELHVVLRELDLADGVEAENPYYRSLNDESGLACYEIQPADSDETVLIPMSSTVIYMTEQGAEDTDAYYEQIALTYMLDGEPVETTQYQIFVPNPIISNVAESSAD